MSSLLLKVDTMLGNAGMTVLIGLVVVFGVLALLTFVFWLFGVVAGSGSAKSAASKPAPKPKAVPAPKKAAAPAAPAPVVDGDVPEEVVAVIAAAVAAMSDSGTRYAVRRISAARGVGARPVWASAGIAENTQPF